MPRNLWGQGFRESLSPHGALRTVLSWTFKNFRWLYLLFNLVCKVQPASSPLYSFWSSVSFHKVSQELFSFRLKKMSPFFAKNKLHKIEPAFYNSSTFFHFPLNEIKKKFSRLLIWFQLVLFPFFFLLNERLLTLSKYIFSFSFFEKTSSLSEYIFASGLELSFGCWV